MGQYIIKLVIKRIEWIIVLTFKVLVLSIQNRCASWKLDLLNVTSLKVKDDSFISLFQSLQLAIAGLCSSRSAGLISSSMLSISSGLILSSPLFDAPRLIFSSKLSDGKFG